MLGVILQMTKWKFESLDDCVIRPTIPNHQYLIYDQHVYLYPPLTSEKGGLLINLQTFLKFEVLCDLVLVMKVFFYWFSGIC